MQGRLCSGSAIPHERPGFHSRIGYTIRICTTAEQYSYHKIVCKPIGGAERGVEGRFSRVGQGLVGVRAHVNEKLAEPPVPVKRGSIEVQIVTERLERFTVGEQKPHRAYVSIICTPVDERRAAAVDRRGGVPRREIIKYQVGSSVGNLSEHVFGHGVRYKGVVCLTPNVALRANAQRVWQ